MNSGENLKLHEIHMATVRPDPRVEAPAPTREAREDARWPVVMHEGKCLAILSPEVSEATRADIALLAAEPEAWVLVPKVAIDWLNGSEPNERGEWFGDVEANVTPLSATGRKPGFWWRSEFRRICEALRAPKVVQDYILPEGSE